MWKLVKAEISYFKWLYILCLTFVIIINLGLTIDERWIEAQNDFPGLRIIWLGIGIVVLFFTLLFNRRSGRIRTKNLLPISNLQLGLSRWISFFIFWILILLILVIFYLINFNGVLNSNWFENLITISGIIIFINSIPILYSDFYSSYFKRWEKIIIGMLWIFLFAQYISLNIIFSVYFDFLAPEFIQSSRRTITSLYFQDSYTIASILLGILMFLATVFTFRKRKLYLE